jgi:hypothetical protein
LTHDSSSASLITTASAEWVPLSTIYHYVLAKSPSPEAAKIAISRARKNGELRLHAEVREHEAKPGLQLRPGEQPPMAQPKRALNRPILASDEFSRWDWERSCATMRDSNSKSLFQYVSIVGNRDDVLQLWPPRDRIVETTMPMAKPVGVSGLVWAVVLTIEGIEKELPTGLAGLTQEMLTKKVSEKLSRKISLRTLQKAVTFRQKRNPLT